MSFFEIFDKSKKELKIAQQIAEKVDALSEEYAKLSDEEFKQRFEYSKNDSVIRAFNPIYKNQKVVFEEILEEMK